MGKGNNQQRVITARRFPGAFEYVKQLRFAEMLQFISRNGLLRFRLFETFLLPTVQKCTLLYIHCQSETRPHVHKWADMDMHVHRKPFRINGHAQG